MIMEESEEVSEAIIEDRTWKRCLDRIVQNIVLVSGLAGFAIGMIITTYVPLSEQDKFYIGFPGEILIRMFQMVSIPLIVTAVVSCVSETVDIPTKMARNVAVYFVLTTLVSVAIGLILVVMVKPGVVSVTEDEKKSSIVYVLLDVASNMVPHNLVQACFQQYQTDRLEMEIHTAEPNSSVETLHTEVRMVGNYVEGANILGLTVCSFTFGIVLKGMGERGRIILNVLSIINQTTKYVVNWILCYLPVGLLFLITRYVVEVLDLDRLYALGNFLAVVFLGLIIHAAIVLPIVYLLSVRRNPWVVFRGVYPALWTALLTSSSSATLPQTFHCCEQRISINRRITCLMLPIATNVSMNGTVLYEVVAAVFIAQLSEINLELRQLLSLGVTSVISTLKAVGIPATGVATTFFVLSAVGLPAMEAAILVVVNWLLDRCNTVVNVWGSCIAVAIINQLSRDEMEKQGANRRRTGSGAERHDQDAEIPSSSQTFESIESFHSVSEDYTD
ncbi:excitatory amino acid transporter 3-like [Seriola aureovittata]|uniref:excitatory amino acid transporter 3-like n=1 Tax=Seriola aureovittata TaxID=2871759 RepID=UPI0024BD7FD7|nr:excitatory amino acid transporter 3-like [Seriola aureovittata]